jgi:cobalt-precorrin-7 (C5)-methyltransferase
MVLANIVPDPNTNGYSLTIVGCGPGGLEYLTPVARCAIDKADLLAGASRLLDLFPTSSAERIVMGCDVLKVLKELELHVGRRNVAVLVSGDPGICSLAQPVVQKFGWQACRIIPGVSSVQVAFARLGLDWTDARILSAHHRAPQLQAAPLSHESKIAVLAGNTATAGWIVSLAEQLTDTHFIFVCEDLTLTQERISQLDAAQLADGKFSPQSIVLFIGKKIRT